jgi:hypothetical protein
MEAAFANPDSALLTRDIGKFTDVSPEGQLNSIAEY